MEFISRSELAQGPFNLQLSRTELLDMVRSGRLVPYRKVTAGRLHYGPPDLLSGSHVYEPIFPISLQQNYQRLKNLRFFIHNEERWLKKSIEEELQDIRDDCARKQLPAPNEERTIQYVEELRVETQEQLRGYLEEASGLGAEFDDLASLYACTHLTTHELDLFWEDLEDAYFERRQVEALKAKRRKVDKEVWEKIHSYAVAALAKGRPTQCDLAVEIQRDVPGAGELEVETIVKRIRPVYPDYTPGRAGRKSVARPTSPRR